jgi:PAS domain-containing protein
MLRRKTIIVLVITLMVTVMVAAFSVLYISQILSLRIVNANETATNLAHQLAYAVGNSVPDFGSTSIDTNNPVAVRRALAEYVQTDVDLNNLLLSETADWRFIQDVSVTDVNGRALLHSQANMVGKVIPPRPDFQKVVGAHFREQMRLVFSPATVYDVTYAMKLNEEPFVTIRIGVQTAFLKSEVQTRLMKAAYSSIALIFVSLFLAAGISNLALGPLKKISLNLDSVSAGDADSFSGNESGHDEYGLVSLKIANLGRQIRDSREIFSALKDNVDQLMAKLQDGLMLFARDSRVVLVSAPVEAFLGRPRGELLGHTIHEVFDRDSLLGAALLEAFERRRPLSQREFEVAGGKRVQVSLDFVQEKNSQIGALLIMRGALATKSKCLAASPPAAG